MKLITILGPTATGKTKLAATIANVINGEIISADSRQVYREMTLGTGKDYADYIIEGKTIPYHLVDIAEPGSEYNIFQFQRDFVSAFKEIASRNKMPILCGGSGMYLESIIKKYALTEAPLNNDFRSTLEQKTHTELREMLQDMRKVHNKTDIETRERLIRAIEIENYITLNPEKIISFPDFKTIVFGIDFPREKIRERITHRLKERLESGMIQEVQKLLDNGISPERLKQYGLEYKFITMFILNEINAQQMFQLLNTAIHQFAKKQMTWFRRMEKHGILIHWLDGTKKAEENVAIVLEKIQQ